MNFKKYSLGICELFHPKLHGFTNSSSLNIESHYIINITLDIEDFWNYNYQYYIEDILYLNYLEFYNNQNFIISHPIIRNYNNILNNINYLKIDIIKIVKLSGGEEVGIIKTFWLKLFQRYWKEKFKNKKAKIQKLKNIYILRKREIIGKI